MGGIAYLIHIHFTSHTNYSIRSWEIHSYCPHYPLYDILGLIVLGVILYPIGLIFCGGLHFRIMVYESFNLASVAMENITIDEELFS